MTCSMLITDRMTQGEQGTFEWRVFVEEKGTLMLKPDAYLSHDTS